MKFTNINNISEDQPTSKILDYDRNSNNQDDFDTAVTNYINNKHSIAIPQTDTTKPQVDTSNSETLSISEDTQTSNKHQHIEDSNISVYSDDTKAKICNQMIDLTKDIDCDPNLVMLPSIDIDTNEGSIKNSTAIKSPVNKSPIQSIQNEKINSNIVVLLDDVSDIEPVLETKIKSGTNIKSSTATDMKSSTTEPDIQLSTVTDMKSSITEPADIQSSTATDMKSSTTEPDIQLSTVTDMKSSTTEPADIQSSTVTDMKSSTTEPADIQSSTATDMKSSTTEPDIQLSTVTDMKSSTTEPADIQSSTATDMKSSTTEPDIQLSTVTDMKSSTTEPADIQSSTATDMKSSTTEPDIQLSTVTDMKSSTTEPADIQSSTATDMKSSTTEPDIQLSTVTDMKSSTTEPADIQSSTATDMKSSTMDTDSDKETNKKTDKKDYTKDIEHNNQIDQIRSMINHTTISVDLPAQMDPLTFVQISTRVDKISKIISDYATHIINVQSNKMGSITVTIGDNIKALSGLNMTVSVSGDKVQVTFDNALSTQLMDTQIKDAHDLLVSSVNEVSNILSDKNLHLDTFTLLGEQLTKDSVIQYSTSVYQDSNEDGTHTPNFLRNKNHNTQDHNDNNNHKEENQEFTPI